MTPSDGGGASLIAAREWRRPPLVARHEGRPGGYQPGSDAQVEVDHGSRGSPARSSQLAGRVARELKHEGLTRTPLATTLVLPSFAVSRSPSEAAGSTTLQRLVPVLGVNK